MGKVTLYGEIEGISLEQTVRYGKFDMRVKHFRNQCETSYIIEEECPFFFNNREYTTRSGNLIPVDTNLIHMMKPAATEDMGHNRVILYVSHDRMKALDGQYPSLQLVRFFHEYYGVYHPDKEQRVLFLNFYRNLRIAMTEKARSYKVDTGLETLTWFFKITSYVSKQEGASPHSSDHPKYRTAYAIANCLSKNCEQNISLDELAVHFYFSKYYVCRTFREITGYTATEYAGIHRIRKVKRLLEGMDMGILQITRGLGYESLAHLERMSKLFMTVSPLKYRRALDTVTYINKQTTGFEEDTGRLSPHRQPYIHHSFV